MAGKIQPIAFPFPIKGLDQNWLHGQQPDGTTPDAVNVRSYDTLLDRLRGGRRAGLSKWNLSTINGANPIQDINRIKSKVVKSAANPDLVVVGQDTGATYDSVTVIDEDGDAIASLYDTTDFVQSVVKDDDGYFYAGGNSAGGKNIWKVDSAGTLQWSALADLSAVSNLAYDYHRGRIVAVGPDNVGGEEVHVFNASTGALVYKFDIPDLTAVLSVVVGLDGDYYIGCQDQYVLQRINPKTGVAKWRWDIAGIGLQVDSNALDIDASGNLLVGMGKVTQWGVDGALSGSAQNLFSVDSDGSVNWSQLVNFGTGIDTNERVHTCRWTSDSKAVVGNRNFSAAVDCAIKKVQSDSTVDWTFTYSTANDPVEGMSISFDDLSVYISGYRTSTYTGAGAAKTVFRLLLTDGSIDASWDTEASSEPGWDIGARIEGYGAVYDTKDAVTVVSDGSIRTIREGVVGTPTGSDDVLSDTGLVMSQEAFGHIFFVDGLNKKDFTLTYDGGATDTVEDWTANDGTLPLAPSLITLYRGRIVMNNEDDPHNWYMARSGDPYDFNYIPSTTDVLQPVAGNNSDAGEIGDVITAMIPHNDDELLFGCDSSIWMLSGDPAAGGAIDQISDTLGIAFGKAWTYDLTGTLYFYGADNNIYMMARDGSMESLTSSRINRLLANMDRNGKHIELRWDSRQRGLYVLNIDDTTYIASDVVFWEQRSDAWWEDEYPATIGLSTMYAYDADDPDDRTLLVGGIDGYIRETNLSADSDDGNAITARVRYAPTAIGSNLLNTELSHITAVMGEDSGAVTMKVYADETAEKTLAQSSPRFVKALGPGRNPDIKRKVRANTLQLELYSSDTATWAADYFTGFVSSAGKTRRRKR